MKVQIVIVETDPDKAETFGHSLEFDMPAPPQAGDCILISRPDQSGSTHLLVRRCHWSLDYPEIGTEHHADHEIIGSTHGVVVECEFEAGSYASEEHK